MSATLPNDWRTLEHFETQDKVYWVVNRDVNEDIRANAIVPAIYVEKVVTEYKEPHYSVLPLDRRIADDPFRYTAWRKLLGELYNVHVDVLLANGGGTLYTLANEPVDFSTLTLADDCPEIKRKYLAKFSLKSHSL